LFEFDIVCRGYDYITDAQKLKIFLATLAGLYGPDPSSEELFSQTNLAATGPFGNSPWSVD